MSNTSARYAKPNRDWDKLPFQANGAGIAIYSTVITTLVSTNALTAHVAAIVPAALYFLGLLFAFVPHSINVRMDADIEQREKLNDAMNLVAEYEKNADQPEVKSLIESLAHFVAQKREALLTLPKIQRMQNAAAYCYGTAMFCFLISTLIAFVYFSYFLASASNVSGKL